MAKRPDRAVLPAIQALQTRSGRLTYMLSGEGPANLVLFSGAGVSLQGWEALYPDIEKLGPVFAWNRFGMQGSDAAKERQTGTVVVASLRELLGYVGLQPPYVLVAHSLGGLFANLYARLYPQDVAGVLFLEATHPDFFWYGIHGVEALFTVMGTGCRSVSRTSAADFDVDAERARLTGEEPIA